VQASSHQLAEVREQLDVLARAGSERRASDAETRRRSDPHFASRAARHQLDTTLCTAMTVPQDTLSISLDAPPVEQLAHLARLKRAVVGTRAAKQAVLDAGGATRCAAWLAYTARVTARRLTPRSRSLVALLQPRAGPDFEGSLAVSAEAANVLAALSIRACELSQYLEKSCS